MVFRTAGYNPFDLKVKALLTSWMENYNMRSIVMRMEEVNCWKKP